MSEELKPCPFCGGSNITEEASISVVFCADCGGEKDTDFGGDWNTRPIEDALNARIAELEAERRWIPVSERLPEDGREVLVLVEELITAGAHYQFGAAFNDDDVLVETPTWVLGLEEETYGFDAYAAVTHWMPLPEPPEVK